MSWHWTERPEPDSTATYYCNCSWQGLQFEVWVSPCDELENPAWQWVCYSPEDKVAFRVESARVYSGAQWFELQSAAEAQQAAEQVLSGLGFLQEATQ